MSSMLVECFLCRGTGYVVWDEDQSRWRESDLFPGVEPKPCPACNVDGLKD